MKVKIGYRVDLEDVPKSVSANLKPYVNKLNDVAALHELCVKLLNNSNNVVSVQAALNMLNDIRQQIVNIDTVLADASSLLIDYTNVIMGQAAPNENKTEVKADADEG